MRPPRIMEYFYRFQHKEETRKKEELEYQERQKKYKEREKDV